MYTRGHRASNAFDETVPPPLESRQGRPNHGGEPRPRPRPRRFLGGTGIRARRHRAGGGGARAGGGWAPGGGAPGGFGPRGGGGGRAPRPPFPWRRGVWA